MRLDRLTIPLVIACAGGLALALALVFVGAVLPVLPVWLNVLITVFAAVASAVHGWFIVKAAFAIADPPKSALETGRPPLEAPDGTMRGGWMIGLLERTATAVAIGVGQFGAIAVIVAVKAVGRFGELDKPASRERFIIGTLASLGVAGLWGTVAYLFRT
ncbi:hypothetical protein [Agrococcus casei]|uniref:hypothetical protein n=1 Tax=Agrococcus casei TaxID=343512 RepID=UPI003F924059